MSSNKITKDDLMPGRGPDMEFVAQQLRKPSGSFASRIAEKMDQGNRPLFELTLETMNVTDHCHILEIGFGSGKYMNDVLLKANNVRMSGIDYSEEMVRQAREYNSGALESGKLRLYHGSSDNLPFEDKTFDKVCCNMVIYFWDTPEAHLSEVHRVLKPEGKFYTGFRSERSMIKFPFTRFNFNLYHEQDWKIILEDNGFTVTETICRQDPEWEDDGETIRLESICMVAVKSAKK